MTPEIRTDLAMWESAVTYAHGGNARKTPLLTAAQLIGAGDKLAETVRTMTGNRQYSGRPEDQEITMSNDDERDYAEEQYNAHLLDDETDPDEDGYDTGSLAKEDARNAWQHDLPVHCTYCGAEVEEQDTGLWETGGDTASARRYCTDAPDHLHVGEATTCDRCGGRLIAGEGDGRYCGPCTEVLADQLDDDDEPPRVIPELAALLQKRQQTTGTNLPGGRTVTRQGHRAAALQLISDWCEGYVSDDPDDPGNLHAAIAHAVLALSAPASPEPDSAWRQRAVEAEAALSTIGWVLANDSKHVPPHMLIRRIEHILREAGRQADRLPARYRPDTPEGAAWKEGYETAVRNLQGPA